MNKKIRAIYVDCEVWQQFLKICEREGTNASQKIEAFMQAYNQEHRNGNPQLLLTHYVKPEEPQPIRVLCIYCDGALSEGKVFCQKRGMWIPSVSCYSCEKNQLRKKK